MKVLICGVGKITRHLLRRLGDSWRVTLLDMSEDRLNQLVSADLNIERMTVGDAASPVALDEVGVANFDYVLALTDNDKVNLATARYAKDQGVVHILSLVNEHENQEKFEELGVRCILGSTLLARNIFHYLQDPRIHVTPLTLGPSEIIEVDVAHHFRMIGRPAAALIDKDWKLVAVFRKKQLIFAEPELVIEANDRLVIIGKPDVFRPICDLLECDHPHFPLAYGQGMVVALTSYANPATLIRESMHLAQNTKVKHLTVFSAQQECSVQDELKSWSQTIDIRTEEVEGDVLSRIQESDARDNCGLVVVHPFEASFFKSMAKSALVSLAHSLTCPLLVARNTQPYERILVPFNGSPKAELGLELAADLARQLNSEVAIVIVQQADFITGSQGKDWIESNIQRAREIIHIHKVELREIVRKGNPVKEIVQVAKDFNLLVMGSTTKDKTLFAPHVGELLAQEVPCSVLIVTK